MPVAIGPQCLVGGSAADPYLQVTKRPLFDLEERCSPVLLDPCHGSVTSDGLDTIDGLAVGGEQIAAALVLIVKAGFELSILRFERGSIGAVEGAFGRIDGCQPEAIEDVACGRLRLLLKFGLSFDALQFRTDLRQRADSKKSRHLGLALRQDRECFGKRALSFAGAFETLFFPRPARLRCIRRL